MSFLSSSLAFLYSSEHTGKQMTRVAPIYTIQQVQQPGILATETKIRPGHATICLMSYANNKGADQPAHPRSLISTFVVRCSDSMMCILALSKVSRL